MQPMSTACIKPTSIYSSVPGLHTHSPPPHRLTQSNFRCTSSIHGKRPTRWHRFLPPTPYCYCTSGAFTSVWMHNTTGLPLPRVFSTVPCCAGRCAAQTTRPMYVGGFALLVCGSALQNVPTTNLMMHFSESIPTAKQGMTVGHASQTPNENIPSHQAKRIFQNKQPISVELKVLCCK